MLDTRGNTAVYLQFAHARLASILRKAEAEKGVDLSVLKASPAAVAVKHESERALAFELLMFSDMIEVSGRVILRVWHHDKCQGGCSVMAPASMCYWRPSRRLFVCCYPFVMLSSEERFNVLAQVCTVTKEFQDTTREQGKANQPLWHRG